ncbi:hypothetical protein B0H14DRAFT_3483889 [Mycena olivaceomarginata]|nr:hypothetical protein B0H14DRAFT_3483889 [Mycena olivaceomarginata]
MIMRRVEKQRTEQRETAGAGAFAHFLPHLSANIRAYAGALLPALAHMNETGMAHGEITKCPRSSTRLPLLDQVHHQVPLS